MVDIGIRVLKVAAVFGFIVGVSLFYFMVAFSILGYIPALNLAPVGLGYGLMGIFLITSSLRVSKGNKAAMAANFMALFILLFSLFFLRREFFQLIVWDTFLMLGLLGFLWGMVVVLSLISLVLLGLWIRRVFSEADKKSLLKWVIWLGTVFALTILLQVGASVSKEKWIDSQIKQFKPAKYKPLKFGIDTAVFLGYSLQYKNKNDFGQYDYALKLLKAFKETEAEIIRVGAAYDILLNSPRELALSDSYVKEARKKGKELLLADTQHSQYLSKNKVNWRKFKKLHLRRIEFFTRRYRPDYYSVGTEVSVYHDFEIRDEMNVEEWVKQTQAAVNLVKKISPNTKTMVYVNLDVKPHSKNQTYLKKVLPLKNLDIVGVDFFSPSGLQRGKKFLRRINPHAYGKELWLTETWYGAPYPASSPWKRELDAKWVRLTYNFAQKYNFDAYFLYPFGYFVSYSNPYLGEKVDFFQRTPAFAVYKEIIKSKGRTENRRINN